ncbi:hemin-degrading factor [Psychromarinibacter sp. C21-152]|uniref:Hemin-degrading factor n=1 Tax=Psychromarinibacter sediminicola TaxID=3033385 RepID=A0AAE3NW19_9RHOB|nr:ChuX/HutX family heme-like substrate-binding protein [Psychromarinibacter sediminicola]MDF0603289.1 hemin-degrading factor [Psychromarinibacter sediminicola]
MAITVEKTAGALRHAMADNTDKRPRDLADMLGVREADLVAARVGRGATRIGADPHALMPRLRDLGEVMALTRNDSAVHEKIGVYDNYRPGDHAAMVLTKDIDLRLFPRHWVHAFAVELESDRGTRRSLQVFDAAGDAVHKVILRDGSDVDAWRALVADLATGDSADTLDLAPRQPPEPPKSDIDKREALLREWDRMTDTHQFLRLTSKLKMNRLGAYRIAGAPYVRPLRPDAMDLALETLAGRGVGAMVFVGNRGCIQIHTGPIHTVKRVGPWQNIMDPGFNLHLRSDHIAELWAVEKPTKRGPALSLEGFDSRGALILQVFGLRTDELDERPAFAEIVDDLPEADAAEVVS